jgi:hypothetical protein
MASTNEMMSRGDNDGRMIPIILYVEIEMFFCQQPSSRRRLRHQIPNIINSNETLIPKQVIFLTRKTVV